MRHILPDFKPGPLDFYRKKASFDWKKLKVLLDTEEIIQYEQDVVTELQKYPDYEKPLLSETFDEQRRRAVRQAHIHKNIGILSLEHLLTNLKKPAKNTTIMMQISPDSTIKYSVGQLLYSNTIRTLGTSRHADFLGECEEGKTFGCFCLTEIGHGTNTKGMQTTATYDKTQKQFILHSPDFEAAKCWAGGLGQGASHAVVFAQLVIDGKQLGLHCFVVPLRDPKTLQPYPGVIVGDLGEKIGLNGIDNGFVQFTNYPIPRENLLNKTGDVTEDGQYVTPFKDPKKRHGASLGGLSGGRVSITTICTAYGTKALTIAIRYAAVRRQFGPDGEPEVPILEYQTHQYRLLPYLAAIYALKCFSDDFHERYYQFSLDSIFGNNIDSLADLGVEIHAISSGCKPLAGWVVRDAIQECREACGGHGYLRAAGIGDIRNDHDANCTYEGENHVLIQQTSNWLLKFWPLVLEGRKISTPMRTADFLSNAKQLLNLKFTAKSIEDVCDPRTIVTCYQWLICYLLKATHNKLSSSLRAGQDEFWSRSQSQVFYAKNLAVAFIQHVFVQRFLEVIERTEDQSIKNVLLRLVALFGLWSLEKNHLPTFYQGGFATGPNMTVLVQDAILKLCGDIKDDAVSLIDAIAPCDYVLNSVLGSSDGMVYQRLQAAIFQSPYAMSRPTWWKEHVDWKSYVHSKL